MKGLGGHYILNTLMKIFAKSCGLWITISVIVLLLGIEIGFSFWKWDWLREDTVSAAIRNVGLVMAATIAIPLAVWRGYLAHRQANIAQQQVEKSQQQVETSQQGLRNERYQKAVEMIGDEVLAVRLGGIYALQRLSGEAPEEYHVQIMSLFCSFVRHPTKDDEHEKEISERERIFINENMGILGNAKVEQPRNEKTQQFIRREDVEAVMRVIRGRPKSSIALEITEHPFQLDFHGAYLANLYKDIWSSFEGSNSFIRADFSDAKLIGAIFRGLDFTDALFIKADLSNAFFVGGSNLAGAAFVRADLSGTEFSEVRGLTQAQLGQACAYAENPPIFHNVCDAETSELLVWHGGLGEPVEDYE